MKRFRTDLHVHTVLSPCAEIEMIPPLIVQEAVERGIQVIAVTDHNGTANIPAVQRAAEGSGLVVLPGMEVQTREEVHVLCLFDTYEQAKIWQTVVDTHLPQLKNRPDFFGDQLIVDETGDLIKREERLLLNSIDLSFNEVWEEVQQLGGLFIPAHVNRKANGLIENLGLVPPEIPVIGLEISRHVSPTQAKKIYPQIRNYPLVQNGDVHRLDDFLGSTYFEIEQVSIAEIRMAILGEKGRCIQVLNATKSMV